MPAGEARLVARLRAVFMTSMVFFTDPPPLQLLFGHFAIDLAVMANAILALHIGLLHLSSNTPDKPQPSALSRSTTSPSS